MTELSYSTLVLVVMYIMAAVLMATGLARASSSSASSLAVPPVVPVPRTFGNGILATAPGEVLLYFNPKQGTLTEQRSVIQLY